MKKRFVSAVVCLCLAICLLPGAAAAQEPDPVYVALGDSITSGYGLSAQAESFPVLLAGERGLTVYNWGAPGATAGDVLAALKGLSAEESQILSGAALVTLTVGGNDLMDALYGYLVKEYNAAYSTSLTARELLSALMGAGQGVSQMEVLSFAAEKVVGFAGSAEAAGALTQFAADFAGVLTTLRQLAPEAEIVMATQYNPYRFLAASLAATSYGEMAENISGAFEAGVQALNGQITAIAAQGGCGVADVYTAFAGAQRNPCNASLSLMSDPPVNLDFHPNAYGHTLIAQTIGAVTTVTGKVDLPFADVPDGAWYEEAVAYVYANGLMAGTGSTTFAPGATTTRGMIVTILYRLEGEPAVTAGSSFTDVGSGAWYADAVAWAAANSIVGGYGGGKFGPEDNITREQMAAILYRYAQYKGYDVSVGEDTNILSYVDADQMSEYAIPALQWACGAGLLSGKGGGVLDPAGTATRAEVATILMRFGGAA